MVTAEPRESGRPQRLAKKRAARVIESVFYVHLTFLIYCSVSDSDDKVSADEEFARSAVQESESSDEDGAATLVPDHVSYIQILFIIIIVNRT